VHGSRIRQLLSRPLKPDPDMMLELFVRDREEDVAVNIAPSLSDEKIILLDRYYFSNAAYQGASGISFKRILTVNSRYGFPVPDRVYLFDIEPTEALARIASRNSAAGAESDAFEKGPFLNDVREIYRKMADETFVIIDAAGSREQILSQILDDIDRNFADAE
jgi:dTMP kinase